MKRLVFVVLFLQFALSSHAFALSLDFKDLLAQILPNSPGGSTNPQICCLVEHSVPGGRWSTTGTGTGIMSAASCKAMNTALGPIAGFLTYLDKYNPWLPPAPTTRTTILPLDQCGIVCCQRPDGSVGIRNAYDCTAVGDPILSRSDPKCSAFNIPSGGYVVLPVCCQLLNGNFMVIDAYECRKVAGTEQDMASCPNNKIIEVPSVKIPSASPTIIGITSAPIIRSYAPPSLSPTSYPSGSYANDLLRPGITPSIPYVQIPVTGMPSSLNVSNVISPLISIPKIVSPIRPVIQVCPEVSAPVCRAGQRIMMIKNNTGCDVPICINVTPVRIQEVSISGGQISNESYASPPIYVPPSEATPTPRPQRGDRQRGCYDVAVDEYAKCRLKPENQGCRGVFQQSMASCSVVSPTPR